MVEPNFYKRDEDRKWREQVDARLAALTSGENDQNDRLDSHDETFARVDALVEGKPDDRNDNGIKGDIKDLSVSLNSLRALMQPDSLGNGGIINRLKLLEKKEERETRSLEYRWKFYLALLSLLGLVIGGVIKEWPEIRTHFPDGDKPAINAPAKAKRKHRKARPAPIIEEEAPNGESQTSD